MSTTSADAARTRPGVDETRRNLASIRPSFIVKDLQASIAYYRDRLGFQLDFQGPDQGPNDGQDDDPFWAGVSRDGIGIMLKAVAPTCRLVRITPGTNGPLRMRTFTASTRMRCSMNSAGAVRRS
jgi:catechol 2,3-dioxygenase-like lactoylglutathione lyase family enzyme